ncbi:hypothetical protein GQ53DRAFT_853962 [Thozetella sp. PMI_491]|nr:hypothetical protein GQ53DRAFT_853962 [Thozetella sp. PMI_491]
MGRHSTSGYCLTCRARRVKCDRERPSCQRCLRSGHSCRGYEPENQLRMHNLSVSTDAGGSKRLSPLLQSSRPGSPNPTMELDLSGFRETMAFTYFFERYTWGHFWKPLIRLHADNDVHLEYKSSLALVYGYFGLGNQDKATEVKGLELYGNLIRQVKSVLVRGDKDELAKLTASVLILGMFTYCGPSYFKEEPLFSAFRSSRCVTICQSFALRRRIFLEYEEWRTLPFEVNQKKASDYLFDMLAHMPGIVEDIANLQQPDSQVSRDELVRKVSSLTSQLGLWRLAWGRKNPEAAQQRPVPLWIDGETQQEPIERLLHSSLEFQTLEQAMDIFVYNAALLYLMQLGEVLGGSGPKRASLSEDDLKSIVNASSGSREAVLLAPGEIEFFCQPAVEAVRILPYLHRNWIAERGKVILVQAPVGIVYCVLQKQPELRSFIAWESMLTALTDSTRMELGAYEVPMDLNMAR